MVAAYEVFRGSIRPYSLAVCAAIPWRLTKYSVAIRPDSWRHTLLCRGGIRPYFLWSTQLFRGCTRPCSSAVSAATPWQHTKYSVAKEALTPWRHAPAFLGGVRCYSLAAHAVMPRRRTPLFLGGLRCYSVAAYEEFRGSIRPYSLAVCAVIPWRLTKYSVAKYALIPWRHALAFRGGTRWYSRV